MNGVGLKALNPIKKPPYRRPIMIPLVAGDGFEPPTFGL
jgi:hypothetical protein